MDLTNKDKNIMISVLKTLIYNKSEDLKQKLITIKNELNQDKYHLLINGNNTITDKGQEYKTILELDNRWCLRFQLLYHLNNTKKISAEEYEDFLKI